MSILEHARLSDEIERLGPWFHNLHLPGGSQTSPQHILGDFPASKWRQIAPHVPDDLTGWRVLDIGCNAGFYSLELARRGAEVTAIDIDPHYLRQAEWAAKLFRLDDRITFRQMQVYDLAHTDETYDLVWFMGVLYHLRHPLLALDIVTRRTRKLLMFQTMTMPGEEPDCAPGNMGLGERERMLEPGWPKMAFVEHHLADDPTNWWAPSHTCVVAMLRSCGFQVVVRPLHEVYLCAPGPTAAYVHSPEREAEYEAATGRSRAH